VALLSQRKKVVGLLEKAGGPWPAAQPSHCPRASDGRRAATFRREYPAGL